MTTNYFTVLMLVCAPLGAYLIVLFFRFEKRLGRARPLSGLLLYPLLLGILYLFYLDGAMDGDRGNAFMRQQLNIPADVSINTLNGGKKHSVCYSNAAFYRTSAQFSPEQFTRYAAATAEREIWRPFTPAHFDFDGSRYSFADEALQWRDLPAPPYYGSQQMVYKIAGEDVRRGRAFCYDITPLPNAAAAAVHEGATAYSVTACNAIRRSKTPSGGGQLKAVLDFDKQRLVIAMHFDGKAAYCNNRVTKWLNERLGLDAN